MCHHHHLSVYDTVKAQGMGNLTKDSRKKQQLKGGMGL